jgi:sugar/nucleoside kinase (ribokinase family)
MICTLGDLLLDVIVRVDGPIAEDTDTYGRTRVGAGGQAANVAAWRGVELAGPEEEAGTGTVVSLAGADGSRTMLTDRGVAVDFRPDELDPAWLEGAEWLHVPGYSLAQSPIRETALAATRLVPRVSVDLSSTAAIEAAGRDRFRETLEDLEAVVVLGNEAEVELVGELDVEMVVVKRGARGAVVRRGGTIEELPALPANAVDSTGAGDAFAAGFLLGGARLGLEAAARCVATLGAMP